MQIFFSAIRKYINLIFFFQEYTRGPCPEGKLMVLDRDSGYGKCSCDDSLVKKRPQYGWKITYFWNIPIFFFLQRMYYHEPTGQCYELYKQGPCAEGHILSFNYGSLSPQCKCKDDYHLHSDGKCYKLNTKG